MTVVYLVRHGTHDLVSRTLCGRTTPVGLNPVGRSQAKTAAETLRKAGAPLDHVVTSPQTRTRETAAVIGEVHGLSVEVEQAIDEIDFGDWSGRDFVSLDQTPEWRLWNAERHQTRAPNGESMLEVQSRLSDWLQAVGRSEAGAIAAVSHADVIKSVAALALGLSIQRHDRFDVSPGSITTVEARPGYLKLLRLNEIPHG